MSAADDLYRDVVLDHHRRPRGREPLARVDAEAHGHNPSCGDEVALRVQLEGDLIVGVNVEATGCAISRASGSILADLVRGRPTAEAAALARGARAMLGGGETPPGLELGDLEALSGVSRLPLRVRCAMLPWSALEVALQGAPRASRGEEGGRR